MAARPRPRPPYLSLFSCLSFAPYLSAFLFHYHLYRQSRHSSNAAFENQIAVSSYLDIGYYGHFWTTHANPIYIRIIDPDRPFGSSIFPLHPPRD
ncbi:hypothetical protein B0H11DRAFT_365263 [Mycena galericulata]|nr:hypothetical protein B0H11DRAFT_365263 [Mycena galericulata]